MHKVHLRVGRMERPTVDAAAGRSPQHHGHRRTPAVMRLGDEIGDLIEAASDEVNELHFRHGSQAQIAHAHRGADDGGLADGRVNHALPAEALEQTGADLERAAGFASFAFLAAAGRRAPSPETVALGAGLAGATVSSVPPKLSTCQSACALDFGGLSSSTDRCHCGSSVWQPSQYTPCSASSGGGKGEFSAYSRSSLSSRSMRASIFALLLVSHSLLSVRNFSYWSSGSRAFQYSNISLGTYSAGSC